MKLTKIILPTIIAIVCISGANAQTALKLFNAGNIEAAVQKADKNVENSPSDPNFLHERAIIAISLGDYEAAIKDLNKACICASPSKSGALVPQFRRLLAIAHYLNNNQSRAFTEARSYINYTRRKSPEAYYIMAKSQIAAREYSGARESLKKANALQPSLPCASLYAQVQKAFGEKAEAQAEQVTAIINSKPDSATLRLALLTRYNIYKQAGNRAAIDDAVAYVLAGGAGLRTIVKECVALNSDYFIANLDKLTATTRNPDIFKMRALVALDSDPSEAIKHCRKGLKLKNIAPSDRAELLAIAAQGMINASNYAEAIKTLSEAIDIAPTSFAYEMRAEANVYLKNFDAAIADCLAARKCKPLSNKTETSFPSRPDLYGIDANDFNFTIPVDEHEAISTYFADYAAITNARIYEYFVGDIDKAADAYRQAIRTQFGREAIYCMARLLKEKGDTQSYIETINTIIREDKKSYEPTSVRALALAATGKITEANVWVNTLTTNFPDHPDALYNAARFYAKIGNKEMANDMLRRAITAGYRSISASVDKDLRNAIIK